MASMDLAGGDRMSGALGSILARIGSGRAVRVGFLEGSTYPDGTSVPMVAAVQEFGAPAAGIPSRPFFRNMIAEKSPAWSGELGSVLKSANYDTDVALGRMGERIGSQLQRSILDTNSPALSEQTVARKGFDKPLIDTAQMISSVAYEVEGGDKQFLPPVASPGAEK